LDRRPYGGTALSRFAAETITLPYNDLEKVQAGFEQLGDQIAAVIVESYPANAGLIFPKEGYLKGLRDVTTKYGAVFIFDEVMTGFRVAKGGVQELEGLMPDLTAMGKVIGGGLPVGAFGGKAEIMDLLAPDGPVTKLGHSVGIHWQWRRAWRSCMKWSVWTATGDLNN